MYLLEKIILYAAINLDTCIALGILNMDNWDMEAQAST